MKLNVAIALTCFLSLACIASTADAGKACALENEKLALDTRAMQSRLMVAALSCGERQKYNSFIKQFQSELINGGKDLKKYFIRNYNADAEKQMNKFITSLANEASKNSLNNNPENFCAGESKLFDQINVSSRYNVLKLASSQEFSDMHKISSCN